MSRYGNSYSASYRRVMANRRNRRLASIAALEKRLDKLVEEAESYPRDTKMRNSIMARADRCREKLRRVENEKTKQAGDLK